METGKMTFSELYPRTTRLVAAIILLGCLPYEYASAGQEESRLPRRPALVLYAAQEQQAAMENVASKNGFVAYHVNNFSDIASDLHVLGKQQNFDSRRVYKVPKKLTANQVDWKKLLNRRLVPSQARDLRHAIAGNENVSPLLIDASTVAEAECMNSGFCSQEQLLAAH